MWWKALLVSPDDDPFIRSEIRYIANELYSWFKARGLVIGNPPNTDDSLGKVRQAELVSQYLLIPEQRIVWGESALNSLPSGRSWVAKSLSSQLNSRGGALFTTDVAPESLAAEFPWYLQEKIDASLDITIQIVGDELFAYSRDRSDLQSPDWRYEIFTSATPWVRYALSEHDEFNVRRAIDALGLRWGRMDLLLSGDHLYFLEMNPNGQWAFLDPTDENGLLSAVVHYVEEYPTHT